MRTHTHLQINARIQARTCTSAHENTCMLARMRVGTNIRRHKQAHERMYVCACARAHYACTKHARTRKSGYRFSLKVALEILSPLLHSFCTLLSSEARRSVRRDKVDVYPVLITSNVPEPKPQNPDINHCFVSIFH